METENSNGFNDSKDTNLERLRALNKKRFGSDGLNWTEDERKELLELQNSLDKPFVVTQKHLDAIRHQNTAGIGDSPLLTAEERKLIQEVNSVKK